MGVNLPLTLMGDEFVVEKPVFRVLQGSSAIAELLVKSHERLGNCESYEM